MKNEVAGVGNLKFKVSKLNARGHATSADNESIPRCGSKSFCCCLLFLSRWRVLHVLIEPIDSLRENVQQGFASGVAVCFEGQCFVAHGGALAFQCHVETF